MYICVRQKRYRGSLACYYIGKEKGAFLGEGACELASYRLLESKPNTCVCVDLIVGREEANSKCGP